MKMLAEYGNVLVSEDWFVRENAPCGFVRVYYVHGGDVTYTDCDTKVKLKAGEIYLFPSAKAYSMQQNPSNPLLCTYIHMRTEPRLLKQIVKLDRQIHRLAYSLFDTIKCASESADGRVITYLERAFEEYCDENNIFLMPDRAIAEALKRIGADLSRNIPVKELAAICGYSEHYFIRLFSAQTGLSPHQYSISVKMKEAMRLMQSEEELSMSQIALRVGYPELKAFSRAFKNRYGVSPLKFRKNINFKFTL